ncbi:MAG: SMEK domain-containing protein, partial [bacterium]|nr:SMEK domain-containing protein [bacterium]
EIEANNAEEFYDINKVGEDISQMLLNRIYGLNLENLNEKQKHFPAIDLGDEEEQIAYQITSRTDAAKISDGLETFKRHQLHESFPNGMRFFLITFKTIRRTEKNKKKFAQMVKGFDADRDIINCTDLMREITTIYREDPNRFKAIEEALEREFSDEKQEKPKEAPLLERLAMGSHRYHDNLRGPRGRFKHLQIADLILTGAERKKKTEWIRQPVSLEGDTNRNETVIELLPRLWDKPHPHAVIVGEGGMGKTVSLIRLWERLLEGNKKGEKGPVPVFIPLNEYNEPG